jgi:hypothetical protein
MRLWIGRILQPHAYHHMLFASGSFLSAWSLVGDQALSLFARFRRTSSTALERFYCSITASPCLIIRVAKSRSPQKKRLEAKLQGALRV